MTQVVIENPIINSPYSAPIRHFRFDDDGITNEIVEERRDSSYFVPIAKPKKKGQQLVFDTEWTRDRIEENKLVNDIRRSGATSPTGSRTPGKLKRTLRAEIDEGAWADLYRTVSRPFAKPATGKIAVKAINHYGDEVLKVFGV